MLVCLVFDEKGVHQLLVNPVRNLVRILKDDVLYLTLASAYIILSKWLTNSSFWMASYGHNDEIAHHYKERGLSFFRFYGVGPGPRRGNRGLWRGTVLHLPSSDGCC